MATLHPRVQADFEAAKGFMPLDEGLALHDAAADAAARLPGLPLLEVGTYCGRSTILLAAAARAARTVAVTVDHHRGSEEQQPGWEYHDKDLVDPEVGLMDTLPTFRRTLHAAGFEDDVIAIAGRSPWSPRPGASPSPWSSSTAVTPTSTPPRTTRAGPRTWRRTAYSSCTTCSRTRRTAARRRTACTGGRWPPERSRRCP